MVPNSLLKAIQLLAVGVAAVATPEPQAGRQQIGELGNIIVAGGTAPEVQTLKATGVYPGSQRVKIRYGPYTMPGINEASMMSNIANEKGLMNTVGIAMKKPCSGTCGITAIQAGLEYPNGSIANTANGAWLHHVVVLSNGKGKSDVTCPVWGLVGERFFSSGNERTLTTYGDIETGATKGVYLLQQDTGFGMQLELMNMVAERKTVYYTMDYEFLPSVPKDFTQTKALWLDVTNCGASFVLPPSGRPSFSLKMNPWSSSLDGQMLGVAGHLHDGGVNVNVYKNNQVICNSKATYSLPGQGSHAMAAKGTTSLGVSKRDGPHDDNMPHIDSMGICTNMGPIKRGDRIHIDANYDFNKYMGMKGDGGYAPVMGIAILFISTAIPAV